jgi:hypothetical protein
MDAQELARESNTLIGVTNQENKSKLYSTGSMGLFCVVMRRSECPTVRKHFHSCPTDSDSDLEEPADESTFSEKHRLVDL